MQAKHDVRQGHDYCKTYAIQVSKMWLAPMNHSAEDLKKIAEPALILVCDHDDFTVPVEQAVKLFRAIPRAEWVIVPGTEHDVLGSKPELFTQLVLEFLLRQSTCGEANQV